MFNALYKKCLDLAAHKSSKYYLALVSFIESSFFPIPPDIMVIPMVISKKNDFIKIFLIATIFSVLGGIMGYFLGAFFFEGKISFFGSPGSRGLYYYTLYNDLRQCTSDLDRDT